MHSTGTWDDQKDDDRYAEAKVYLATLRTLAYELDRAMESIATRSLTELQESLTVQTATCVQLAASPSRPNFQRGRISSFAAPLDLELSGLIEDAVENLVTLNRRYSALIRQSSATVQMLAGCFQSYDGVGRAGSRSGVELHTWSCEL